MTAATSFYGVDIRELAEPSSPATADALDVFELLKPQASEVPLIRIGGDVDGSYLVPDDLDGIVACFSPGVNRTKYFEDFLADHYGIKSHMCDFSSDVEKLKTPLKPGFQTFVKKWLDVSPGEDSISLEDWLADHDHQGDLLLQMDIEGAEYRNILATSEDTLARFRVIVLEVHNLRRMLDAGILRDAIAPFFQKLASGFTVVHAHPNNCCGEFTIPGSDVRIPNVLELTYVRNDHFVPAPGPVALPHALDVSRNVPRKPPLHLSEAWCDYQRPLESRLKILEDAQHYQDDVGTAKNAAELPGALSLTMQSLQTLAELVAPLSKRDGDLVEVAGGQSYTLSSAHSKSSKTGVVEPSDDYFFHTGFGRDQSIRVDLGLQHRVRRIEVTNRRRGYQERSRHIFAVLDGDRGGEPRRVFPMYEQGRLPGEAWQECAIDVPDVAARYVTITSPMDTALHFSDLRVYASTDGDRPVRPAPRWTPRRVLRGVRRRVRALRLSR